MFLCVVSESGVQNFQKNLLSKIFPDIQTHPPLLAITIGSSFSVKVSTENFLVGNNLVVIFSIFFLALEY